MRIYLTRRTKWRDPWGYSVDVEQICGIRNIEKISEDIRLMDGYGEWHVPVWMDSSGSRYYNPSDPEGGRPYPFIPFWYQTKTQQAWQSSLRTRTLDMWGNPISWAGQLG